MEFYDVVHRRMVDIVDTVVRSSIHNSIIIYVLVFDKTYYNAWLKWLLISKHTKCCECDL
jgi:hypothetical protein